MMLAMRQAQERQQRWSRLSRRRSRMVAGRGGHGIEAMRGIDLISAATLLAEIGDLSRFQARPS